MKTSHLSQCNMNLEGLNRIGYEQYGVWVFCVFMMTGLCESCSYHRLFKEIDVVTMSLRTQFVGCYLKTSSLASFSSTFCHCFALFLRHQLPNLEERVELLGDNTHLHNTKQKPQSNSFFSFFSSVQLSLYTAAPNHNNIHPDVLYIVR